MDKLNTKTLIIGPSWVGDMLMSQSLFRHLKQQQPEQIIDVLAPDWCHDILLRMPEVNNTISMPVGHGSLQWKKRKKIAKALSEQAYSQAIILPNSLKSALIPWFANIPVRTGWRGEMRYGLLNDVRTLNKSNFPLMVQRYVALAYPASTPALELSEILRPELWVDNTNQQTIIDDFALPMHATIALCPGAEFGPAKRWPDYHYSKLAKKLIRQGYNIWLLGSKKDKQICQQITGFLSATERSACYNLAGRTNLQQAVDLIAYCKAVVSNDSGLMHIAAAVDVPLVALYGPTSPEFTPPLSDNAQVIRLIKGFNKIRRGSANQGYHQSLIDIKPDQVMQTLIASLSL